MILQSKGWATLSKLIAAINFSQWKSLKILFATKPFVIPFLLGNAEHSECYNGKYENGDL